MGQKNWKKAIETYHKILESVRSESRNNHYNEVGCLHSLAVANAELSNWKRVVELANEAFAVDLSLEVAERKEKDIKHLRKLRKQASRNLKNNG